MFCRFWFPPTMTLAFGFALGIHNGLSEPISPWIWSAFLFFLFIFLFSRTRGILFFLLGLGLGFLRVLLMPSAGLPLDLQELVAQRSSVEVKLEAKGFCDNRLKTSRFTAQWVSVHQGDSWRPVDQTVLVYTEAGHCAVIPGQRWKVWVKLSFPTTYRNPFNFNEPANLKRQGIVAFMWSEALEQGVLERQAPSGWKAIAVLRRQWLDHLSAILPASSARGVMEDLVLGERALLDERTEESFRRCGLAHVLAISGLHLTLLLGICFVPPYALFSLQRRWSASGHAHRLALLSAMFPLVIYAAVAGFSPSVLRALLMALGVGVAVAFRWKWDFAGLLGFAALLILASHPEWLFKLSFQLSFLSMLALYFFGQRLRVLPSKDESRSIKLWKRFLFWAGSVLFISVGVEWMLYPLLAENFQSISVVGPLFNIIVTPLFTLFVLPVELLGLILQPIFPVFGGGLLRAVFHFLELLLPLLDRAADFSYAQILVKPLRSWWEWIGYFASLSAWWQWRRWKWSSPLMVAGLAVLVLSNCHGALFPPRGHLTLTMLDVGQGEALLLQLPEGGTVLIDGGGIPRSSWDIGRRILTPELLGRGIRRLDAVLLTHPDADHFKGLYFIVDHFAVESFWASTLAWQQSSWRSLQRKIKLRKISQRLLEADQRFTFGGAQWEVLWPPESDPVKTFSDNNQSLVIRVCYREVCYLLTGDLESRGEREMLSSGNKLRSQVLKIAHHGSKTSTTEEFLRSVEAEWGIISTGVRNRFGMPHSLILERLRRWNIQVRRTDEYGQIEIKSDGKQIWLKNFSAPPVPNRWSAIQGVLYE